MGKDKMASRIDQLREFNQYDPYQQRKVREAMQGHWRFEFLMPITKVVDWFKKKRKRQVETEWAYECGCIPTEGYQSDPYCPTHGLKLYLREVV